MTKCKYLVSARERGAAAVEFALVSIILFTLVFGILEGGRLWMIQGALSQAAREGAREMAINGKSDAEVVITNRTKDLGVDLVVPYDISPDTCTAGATAVVKVSANVKSMTGILDTTLLPLFTGSDSMKLTGKAEMRCGG